MDSVRSFESIGISSKSLGLTGSRSNAALKANLSLGFSWRTSRQA